MIKYAVAVGEVVIVLQVVAGVLYLLVGETKIGVLSLGYAILNFVLFFV